MTQITQQDRLLAERITSLVQDEGANYLRAMRTDEVASLLAEAREAQHKASWEPIETAPKDKPIIGAIRGSVAYVCWWDNAIEKWVFFSRGSDSPHGSVSRMSFTPDVWKELGEV